MRKCATVTFKYVSKPPQFAAFVSVARAASTSAAKCLNHRRNVAAFHAAQAKAAAAAAAVAVAKAVVVVAEVVGAAVAEEVVRHATEAQAGAHPTITGGSVGVRRLRFPSPYQAGQRATSVRWTQPQLPILFSHRLILPKQSVVLEHSNWWQGRRRRNKMLVSPNFAPN